MVKIEIMENAVRRWGRHVNGVQDDRQQHRRGLPHPKPLMSRLQAFGYGVRVEETIQAPRVTISPQAQQPETQAEPQEMPGHVGSAATAATDCPNSRYRVAYVEF